MLEEEKGLLLIFSFDYVWMKPIFVWFKFRELNAISPVLLLNERKEEKKKKERRKLNASSPVLLLKEGREKEEKKKEKTHRIFSRPPLEGGKRRDTWVVLVLDL